MRHRVGAVLGFRGGFHRLGTRQAQRQQQAAALLKQTPNPTDAQIDAAMERNLCRCMAYIRIKRAIKLAASRGVKA